MTRKNTTLWGAALGLVVFLGIALLPAMLYGGYAGVLLAGGILGTPIHATLLARSIIVGGMVLGVTGIGALFTVTGAASGALLSIVLGPKEVIGQGERATSRIS